MSAISCVIVSYNSSKELPSCLAAVRDIPGIDLIVVDNASSDDSCAIAREYGARVIANSTNLGFAGGVNIGVMAASKGRDVLLLNPDCQVNVPCIRSLAARLRDNGQLGIVAPTMQYPDGSIGVSGGSRPSLVKEWAAAFQLDRCVPNGVARNILRILHPVLPESFVHYLGTAKDGRLHRVDWVSGFCMLIRREVLTSIGGLSERFFLYFEDVDLCERATEAGWFCGIDASVTAVHSESSAALRVGKSKLYFDGLVAYFSPRGVLARTSCRALRRLAS
jgi:GT2 family glycosyltransferase